MTRNEINIGLCGILSTAAAIEPDPMPLGPAYAALNARGYTLSDWDVLTTLLREGRLAHVTATTLTLTDRGREIATRIPTT